MAVNEIDRDYLQMLHHCDTMENIQKGMKMNDSKDEEKKAQVGNIVMMLERDILDDKWTTNKKDLTKINAAIKAGRTYWKS